MVRGWTRSVELLVPPTTTPWLLLDQPTSLFISLIFGVWIQTFLLWNTTWLPIFPIYSCSLRLSLLILLLLKILLPTTTIFLWVCYRSPNSTNFVPFIEYLTFRYKSLLSSHQHAEVLFFWDFNMDNTEWLGSATTDVGGIKAHSFPITNKMEQLIKHPTRVLDWHDPAGNIIDLFFTPSPSNYPYSISAPPGSSDYKIISVPCSFSSPLPIPSITHQLWFPE